MLGIVRERFKALRLSRPAQLPSRSIDGLCPLSFIIIRCRFGGIAAIAAALSRHQVSVGTRNLLAIQRLIL